MGSLGAFAIVLGLGSTTPVGEATLRAALDAGSEQVDLIRARSPGARTRADMTKGKPRVAARAVVPPRDARASIAAPIPGVLPGPVAAPAVAAPAAAGPPVVVPPAITSGSAVLPGEVPGGVFVGGPGGGFFGSIGGIGGPGIIGGGGGGIVVLPPDAGTTPAPEAPGPAITPPGSAPIPEPSAWALMILGFGVAGLALRTRARTVSWPRPALV